jgi:inosine-uridine nucleoside N-ribohydrolase
MKITQLLAAFAAFGLIAAGARGQMAPAAQPAAAEPQLAIIDTDLGDDIDDAFALALALHSPELRILGVVTAFRDTELRARLADRFLSAVGRSDIVVAAGVPTPSSDHMPQAAYALQAPERKHADGVEYLLEQIRKHPGEITLIAIGPLNNVQAAIERDPATFRKLKRAVIMSGSIYRGYNDRKTGAPQPASAEWNVRWSPAGLRDLLASGVPVFMVPLDSSMVHLETKERNEIFSHGSPLTDQLTLLYHQWLGVNPDHALAPMLCDPVTMAYAVRPDLCPMTPMRIEVDDKGFTRPVEGAPNTQVCLHGDEKGFLDLLVSRLTTDAGH